jgi:hypothetical protein
LAVAGTDMKVLLHLGQSKTGTSAIQTFLTLHNAVADSLVGLSRFPYLSADEYFQQFFKEAQRIDAKLLILSAEHFFGGEPRIWEVAGHSDYCELYRKKIERLMTYLKGHDVSLLVYLRPQLDWLASAASHTVRIERLIPGSPVYQNDRQFFELMKPLLMYATLLEIWEDVVRPSSFMVIPYAKGTLHKGSSISDFLWRAGLETIGLPYASADIQINKSLTREYIEVKKILNKTPRSKNAERVIIRCLERLSESSKESTRYTFSEDICRDLESFVATENARLNERYRTDNLSFVARSPEHDQHLKPVSDEEVARAMVAFEQEYRRPRYRLLSLNYAARVFLREHGKPVQGALHRIKMFYLKVRHRNYTPFAG